MSKKWWIILGIAVAVLIFAGGFFTRKSFEKPEPYVETFNTNQVDSLWRQYFLKFDSMMSKNDSLLKNVVKKQNSIKKSYDNINNVRYIENDDSLLINVIKLTSDTSDFLYKK